MLISHRWMFGDMVKFKSVALRDRRRHYLVVILAAHAVVLLAIPSVIQFYATVEGAGWVVRWIHKALLAFDIEVVLVIVQNLLFAGGAGLVTRFVSPFASGQTSYFRLRTVFVVTALMGLFFSAFRWPAAYPRQTLFIVGEFLGTQAILFFIVAMVLRRAGSTGGGTFVRSFVGLLLAGSANAVVLRPSMAMESIPAPLMLVLSIVVAITIALLAATLVLLWQDDGGHAEQAGMWVGIFVGGLLWIGLTPFMFGVMRERTVDLMSIPIFLCVGGYLANLTKPASHRGATGKPSSSLIYADFDESCSR